MKGKAQQKAQRRPESKTHQRARAATNAKSQRQGKGQGQQQKAQTCLGASHPLERHPFAGLLSNARQGKGQWQEQTQRQWQTQEPAKARASTLLLLPVLKLEPKSSQPCSAQLLLSKSSRTAKHTRTSKDFKLEAMQKQSPLNKKQGRVVTRWLPQARVSLRHRYGEVLVRELACCLKVLSNSKTENNAWASKAP